MGFPGSQNPRPTPRQISVAAQKIAAAQFSLFGFDVLEQSGSARFFYDLGVARSGGMMKVVVHGSLDGFWDLIEPYLDRSSLQTPNYHRAIDLWLERHSSHIICCLVQFGSTDLHHTPRIYLASAGEVAEQLHQGTDRLIGTPLTPRNSAPDEHEGLPARWRFTEERLANLMDGQEDEHRVQHLRLSAATA
ncbi:MAG TPA: hypothetical protein VKU93_01975 [Terracidiphilus sp.]|jgi:hypothetical protein|nr:hypothetical protein [Terracidiphilus sp.]